MTRTKEEAQARAFIDLLFYGALVDKTQKPERVSNCCSARLSTINPDNVTGVCGKCREHCEVVTTAP
jgi:hypothetical protein